MLQVYPLLLSDPINPIQTYWQRGVVWNYWELHEPRDRAAARSKRVATLFLNGSGWAKTIQTPTVKHSNSNCQNSNLKIQNSNSMYYF